MFNSCPLIPHSPSIILLVPAILRFAFVHPVLFVLNLLMAVRTYVRAHTQASSPTCTYFELADPIIDPDRDKLACRLRRNYEDEALFLFFFPSSSPARRKMWWRVKKLITLMSNLRSVYIEKKMVAWQSILGRHSRLACLPER